jgi:hypothetical protein
MRFRLTLALIIGLACLQVTRAQETKPQSPGTQETKPQSLTVQTFSAEDLTARFDKILGESLGAQGACLSYRAVRELQDLARRAALNIVQEKRFSELPQADVNLRLFARALVDEAKDSAVGPRISPETISRVLRRSSNANPNGVCPMFPICK